MSRKTRPGQKQKQALNVRLKEQQRQARYFQKMRTAQARERDRLLINTIKRSSKLGIYNPKELKLTKYRKYRANKVIKEFGELLDPKKFFFVKTPKKANKAIFERAESLHIKHTRTGLIVPKEGHKRVKLRKDRVHKEYYIERSGKTKRGPTKGVRYRTLTPLASVDELDAERDRIRRMADKLGPLSGKDRITFRIIENGLEGYSHHTFSNVELLLQHLEFYRKSIPAKINFFRHIVVEKTTTGQWFAEHPSTSAGRAGRKQRDAIRASIKAKYDNAQKESKKKTGRFRL